MRETTLSRVEDLSRDVATALRSLPGARALYAFGSIPNGTYDEFSDLDLTLVSDDLETSWARLRQCLGRVGPVMLDWRIERTESNWAGTLLLAGTSPFQKVDIGIVSVEREPEWSCRPDRARLWEQARGPGSIVVDESPDRPAYEPAAGSFEHFVFGHLLGAPRYVKARKRGQTLTSWRFAQALAEAALAAAYMSATGAPALARKLTTAEYVELDRRLPGDLTARYVEHLCLADELGMGASVRFFVGELLSGIASTQEADPALVAVTVTLDAFITTALDSLREEKSG